MRHKPEHLLIAVMAAFAVAGVVGTVLDRGAGLTPTVDPIGTIQVTPTFGADAETWFRSIRAHCNPIEVETRFRSNPPPATHEGRMHAAACYALAGKIDAARASIEALPAELRYLAAGVVFDAGHPVADAGDDVAAGPLMELVVEYWPSHPMALYHAGAARFESGSHEAAEGYLERFLVEYGVQDGWRTNALAMLETIAAAR